MYDTDYSVIQTFEVRRYSTLSNLKGIEKAGYTFEYWSYDDFGGRQLDPNAELKSEVLKLYANYTVNRYKVTYHIQYYDEVMGQYQYKIYEPYGYSSAYDYGSEFTLPTGRRNGILLEDFTGRKGYHFSGWTTKVMSEDDVDIKKYYHGAGSNFVLDVPSNVDLYAFFEKNTYNINLHNGIEYVLGEDGKPLRDSDNEYIIKNLSNPTLDNDGVLNATVRFQDELKNTLNPIDLKLTENNAGIAYGEYEFLGWYLDEDYKIALKDHNMTLYVGEDGRPYYSYKVGGVEKRIESVDSGDVDIDNNPIYEFNAYSKWRRKSYAITFNKNSNRATGKIETIYLHRLMLDEDGNYLGEYEKYYDDGEFTYDGYASGKHYARVNLETMGENAVVSDSFRNSNRNYRLVGWTNTSSTKGNDVEWHALWQQEPYTDELVKQRITKPATYKDPVYVHLVSENHTLYAQWSQVFDIKFAYASGSNQQYVVFQGIENEWFVLPNMQTIKDITGSEWKKDYNYFAGWSTGNSSLADKYYEKDANGGNNAGFVYQIKRTNSTLIVIWMREPYSTTYHLNDGTDQTIVVSPVYGGSLIYHPASPKREGYIFDGWSTKKYADGEYARLRREAKNQGTTIPASDMAYTSGSNYKVIGNADYYASWSIDYEIEYDANGGEFTSTGKTKYKYSELIGSSKSPFDLKANLYVGKGLYLVKENYTFLGWNVKIGDSTVSDDLLVNSSINRTTFDFYENKYYKYRAEGITVPDGDKHPFTILESRKVVLVAKWEPNKYDITIIDTRNSNQKRVDKVAFNESYTFPEYDTTDVKYDSKIGYKLVGFATVKDGQVVYALENGNMPTIPAGTISSNQYFYTVYEKKTITLKYQFAKPTESGMTFVDYTPSATGVTVGTVAYGAEIYLPTPTGTEYNGNSKYKFKYWYYLTEEDGDTEFENRVKHRVNNGDVITYCDSNNTLTLYALFEVESYKVEIDLINPYTNKLSKTIEIGVFEKDSDITSAIYNDIMSKVYSAIADDANLSAYQIKDGESIVAGVLKGYKLSALQTESWAEKLETGKKFSASSFNDLNNNLGLLKFVTNWDAQSVKVAYLSDETESAQTKTISTYKFNQTIVTENNTLFDLGTKKIQSWYVKIANGGEPNTYIGCAKVLAGNNGKFASLFDIIDYMVFDLNGVGTINVYANTEQMCTISYYTYDYATGQIATVEEQTFPYGEIRTLRIGTDLDTDDLKFEGWYYNGSKITVLPELNKDNNYTLKIYANFTLSVLVYDVDLQNDNPTLVGSRTINILSYSKTDGYSYLTNITLNSDDIKNLSDKSGYTFYGLRLNDNVYTISQINNQSIKVALNSNNIELCAYYVIEYTVDYVVQDGATFEDDTIATKTDKVTVDHKGNLIKSYSIRYVAKLSGYDFAGWKIKGENTIYKLNDIFTPSSNTTFVAVFTEPEADTIPVSVRFYKVNYNDDVDESSRAYKDVSYKNGNTFAFADAETVDSSWTSLIETLYAWKDLETGLEYKVGQTFSIPRAVTAGKTYRFAGLWIEKYELKLVQPDGYQNAQYETRSKTIIKGERFSLDETPTIETEGIKFNYWKYYLGDDDGYAGDVKTDANGRYVIIEVGDIVRLSKDYSGYAFVEENGVSIHSLKVTNSSNTCTLLGDWTTTTYNLTFKVKATDDSIITFTKNDVPYGTSFSDREVLTDQVIALENENRGIIGWTETEWGTEATNGILNTISRNMTLYAVWQNKHTLTFANEDSEFGYQISKPNDVKFLANELLDLNTLGGENNVIKSVVSKNYTTVYYEDGAWVVVLDKGTTYAQVTGFRSNVTLKDNLGNNYDTIEISDSNVFPAFIAPDADITLTPVLGRVYKVALFDNASEDGGNEIVGYVNYLRSGQTLNVGKYTLTRDTFTFLGWNTDPDAMDALMGDATIITMESSDIELYAIWSSTRRAVFNLKIPTSTGTTITQLISIPLTRANTINKNIISAYLNGEKPSGNGVIISMELVKNTNLQDMGHNVYTFNFNNYLLDGFKVTKNSTETIFTLDDLCQENFGTSAYNTNEDVEITLNIYDVYTVDYTLLNEEGVTGEINYKDYFVAIDDTRTGKLVNGSKIEDLTLVDGATLGVTREHFVPSAWSTSTSENAGTIYDFSNVANLTINKNDLKKIAKNLSDNYLQKYTLYLKWSYEYINVNILAIADIYDNSSSNDTTLVSPYNAYVNASSGQDIDFQIVSNFIYVNNVRKFLYKNYEFNKVDSPSIAQLVYSDVFSIQIPDNIAVNTKQYLLLGFSTKLIKLGESIETKDYYRLGAEITLDDNILNGNKTLNLYPVYALNSEYVTISAINGSAQVKFTYKLPDGRALDNAGFVYIPDKTEQTNDVDVDKSIGIGVHAFTYIEITATNPKSSSYIFSRFDGLGEDDEANRFVRYLDCSILFNENHNEHSHNISAIFATAEVTLNVDLEYSINLKNNFSDDGSYEFAGVNSLGQEFNLGVGDNNTHITFTVNSDASVSVSATNSSYYNYTLYNGDTLINLIDGSKIDIASLNLSGSNGVYSTTIKIVATPKTYKVIFNMSKGAIVEDAKLSFENNYFDTSLTQVDIKQNVANIYVGSKITLPTAQDIKYANGGKFVGFYMSGDADKNIVTMHESSLKSLDSVTFIEKYVDNVYTIEYIFMGDSEIINVEPDAEFTTGVERARHINGYKLLHWAFANGDKAFDDSIPMTADRSYIVHGVYEGNDISIKYVYDKDGGKSYTITHKNGADITTLNESELNDATVYASSYIYGWKVAGQDTIYKAGDALPFNSTGFKYGESENVITLNAVYYDRYQYIITYDMSADVVENISDFAHPTTAYVRTNNADGTSYIDTDLNIKINSIEPIHVTSDPMAYFSYYEVEYSLDGGNTYIKDANNLKVIAGGNLTLLKPFDVTNPDSNLDINTPVRYKLTPVFTAENNIVKVTFNITNPKTLEVVNSSLDADVLAKITNVEYGGNNLFGDECLPVVATTKGSGLGAWTIAKKNTTFDIAFADLDLHKYVIIGYAVQLFNSENTQIGDTLTFTIGSDAGRNISGAFSAVMTPIWAQKYVVYYHDQMGNVIDTNYMDYDANLVGITLNGRPDDANITLNGYTCVGWTTIDNDHVITSINDFVAFGGTYVVSDMKDINLYPAQSKNYTIKFVTYGIDASDSSQFEFKSGLELPVVYIGYKDVSLSTDNTIDLSVYKIIDKLYDTTKFANSTLNKYELLGFGKNATANSTYTLDVNDVEGDVIILNAIWTKKNYKVDFEFVGLDKSGTNILSGVEYSVNAVYGTQFDFGFTYAENKYVFNNADSIKDSNNLTLQEKINLNVLVDYLRLNNFTNSQGVIGSSYTVTDADTITLNFAPVYMLTYVLPAGVSYDDGSLKVDAQNNDLALREIIIRIGDNWVNGDTYANVFDVEKLINSGFKYKFWSVNNETNFFEGGSHTFSTDDLNLCGIDYRIKLYPVYETDFEVNLYYFDSIDKLNAYMASEKTDADKANYYSKLTLSDSKYNHLSMGESIMETTTNSQGVKEIKKDSNGNPISRFDDKFSVTINGVTITKIYQLFDIYKSNQYISYGIVHINSNNHNYIISDYYDGAEDVGSITIYSVASYDGTLINNLYLVYEPVRYNVTFYTGVANLDENNKYVLVEDKHHTYAEIALNETQLNDNGSDDVEQNNRRRYAFNINLGYYAFVSQCSFDSEIYLINDKYATSRISNNSYNYVKWMVLNSDDKGNQTLVDLVESGLVITTDVNNNYSKVSGFNRDTVLIAIFTEKHIEVEVRLTTIDNQGDKVGLDFESNLFGTTHGLFNFGTSIDSENHITTYTFGVLSQSTLNLKIKETNRNVYQINRVVWGSYTSTPEQSTYEYFAVFTSENTDKQIFEIELTYVTYTLKFDISKNVGNTKYYGNLASLDIAYKYKADNSQDYIDGVAKAMRLGNYYIAYLPTTARINLGGVGVATINNYNFVNWTYGVDGLVITNDYIDLSDAIYNDEVTLKANFTPKPVNIRYVIVETNDSNTIRREISGISTPNNLKYGDTITLPTVVVEKDNIVTTGWKDANNKHVDFGKKLELFKNSNIALEEENGVLQYYIVAEYSTLYFVEYSAGNTTYDISEFTSVVSADKYAHAITLEEIKVTGDYYYAQVAEGNIEVELKNGEYLRNSYYTIPNLKVGQGTESNDFGGWATIRSNVYQNNSTFEVLDFEVSNGKVTLTAISSNIVKVKFYITNPKTLDLNNLAIKSADAGNGNIEYIQLNLQLDMTGSQFVDIDTDSMEQTSNLFAFKTFDVNSMEVQSRYFTQMASDINPSSYRFVGWTNEKALAYSSFGAGTNSIANKFDSTNGVLYYNLSQSSDGVEQLIRIADSAKATGLMSFVETLTKANKDRVLYPIWEQKYEVLFVDDNGTTLSTDSNGYYAYNETIALPTQESTGISNNNSKLIGWNNGTTTIKLNTGTNEQGNVYYYGSYKFASTNKETWKPVWETGYSLTLDTNFGGTNRTQLVELLAKYGSKSEDIEKGLKYPYFEYLGNINGNMLVRNGNNIVVDGTTYSSSYRYGDLWVAKDVIDISGYTLSDKDIYPTTNFASLVPMSSYFEFVGWSYTPLNLMSMANMTQSQIDNLLVTNTNQIKLTSDTTLYAVWMPRNINITLYQTRDDMSSARNGEHVDSNKYLNISIPFGKILNLDSLNAATVGKDAKLQEYLGISHNELGALTQVQGYRFDSWAFGDPEGLALVGDIQLIGNVKLYARYLDEYKIVFNTAEGKELSNQTKYIYVVEGESTNIKNWIVNELKQDMSLISRIYYINNNQNETDLAKTQDGALKFESDSLDFSVNMLCAKDKANRVINIYISIEFTISLNAPDGDSSEFNSIRTIKVSPESEVYIKTGSLYETDYKVDMSVYPSTNTPDFVGWFYYDSKDSLGKYSVDLTNEITTYIIKNTGDGYVLVINGDEEHPYSLKNGNSTISTLNFYAKLLVTTHISLGNDNDTKIANFASLTYNQSSVEQGLITITGTDRLFTMTSVYNNPNAVTFYLDSEGYNIAEIYTNKFGDNASAIGYTNNDSKVADSQNINAESVNFNIAKSVTFTKEINGSVVNGQFVKYTINLSMLARNGYKYYIAITPFTFDVEYKVNSSDGNLLNISSFASENPMDFDFKANATGQIIMPADKEIYFFDRNSNIYWSSPKVAVNYETTQLTEDGKTFNIVTFKNVPYGMSLYIASKSQDDMSKHLSMLSFNWTDEIYELNAENNEIPSVRMDGTNSMHKFTFSPVTTLNDTNTGLTLIQNKYAVEFEFAVNEISAFNLYLDIDGQTLGEKDSTAKSWTRALDLYKDDNHALSASEYTDKTSGNTYKKYVILWQENKTLENKVKANDSITNLLQDWIEEYHADFDKIWTDNTTNIQSLNLAQMLRYFVLTNDLVGDSAGFYTYATNKNNKTYGYLDTKNGNVIYSLHDSVVDLHIDLSRAYLTLVSSSIEDYATGAILDTKISRANVSLGSGSKPVYIFDNNHSYIDYNTYINNANRKDTTLIVKAPYSDTVTYTVTPVEANSNHVGYKLSEWITTGSKDIGFNPANKSVTLDTSIANNTVYNGFNVIDGYTLPEVNLVAKVKAETYDVILNNIKLASGQSNILSIAYDQELLGEGYTHYGYTLESLYNSTTHTMPRFKPSCDESHNVPFVSTLDNMEQDYGALTRIFESWQDSANLKFANSKTLVNAVTTDGKYSYNNIILKAGYVDAIQVEFRTHLQGVDSFNMYLQPHNFADQFGASYNELLKSETLDRWSNNIDVYKEGNRYHYYLKGTDNTNSIKVSSLQDILNAYKDYSSSLVSYDGVNNVMHFVVWPRIDLQVVVYNRYVPVDARVNPIKTNTFATLGSKIEFSADDRNLNLSNIIKLDANDYFAPSNLDNYSFGLWFVGVGSQNSGVTPNNSVSVTTDINVYPHYNAGLSIKTGFGGNESIFDATGREKEDRNLNILSTPSYKYITTTDNYDGIERNVFIRFKASGSTALDSKQYKYGILEVYEKTSASTENILYTIRFTANQTSFSSLGWQISTDYGDTAVTLSQTWVNESSENNADSVYKIRDEEGLVKIYPVAYPENVTIKFNSPKFVVKNIKNTDAYADAFSYDNSEMTVAGGSSIIPEINPDGTSTLTFVNFAGNTVGKLTLTPNSKFANIKDDIENLQWEYYDISSNQWLKIDENTRAIQYGSKAELPVRLASDWVTYNLNLRKLGESKQDSSGKNLPSEYNGFKIPETCAKYTFEYSGESFRQVDLSNGIIKVYKGETITYDFATKQINIANGGSVDSISINLNDSYGYLQGWLQYTGEFVGVTETNCSWTPSNDINLYAWVDVIKNIDLKVDTAGNGLESSFKAGLGDVEYTIATPLGLGDSTGRFEANDALSNKTYGTLTIGSSSKVSLMAVASANYNHKARRIMYNGNLSSGVNITNVYAGNFDDTVLVAFDAMETKSKMYLLAGNDAVLREQEIYGGYTFDYTYSKDKLIVSVNNYWGNADSSFTIYYKLNKTNTSDSYYPRNNYYISDVRWTPADINDISNGVGSIPDSNIIGANTQSSAYNGSLSTKGGVQAFVLKYSEYLYQVNINYIINVKDYNEDGSSAVSQINGLDGTHAYVDGKGNVSSSTYAVAINNSVLNFANGGNEDIVEFTISNNSSEYILPGRTGVSGYNITDVQLQSVDGLTLGSADLFGGTTPAITLVDSTYNLVISVERIKDITISFASNLAKDNIKYLYATTNGVNLDAWTEGEDASLEWNLVTQGVPMVSCNGKALTIKGTNITKTITIGNDRNAFNYNGWKDIDGDKVGSSANGVYTNTTFTLDVTTKLVNVYIDNTYWYNTNMSGFKNTDAEIPALLAGAYSANINGTPKFTLESGGAYHLFPDGEIYYTTSTTGNEGYVGQAGENMSMKFNTLMMTGGFKFSADKAEYIDGTKTGGGYVVYTNIGNNDFDVDLTYGSADESTIDIVLVYYPSIYERSHTVTFVTNTTSGNLTYDFADSIYLPLPDKSLKIDNITYYLGSSRQTRLNIGLDADKSTYDGITPNSGYNANPVRFEIDDRTKYNESNKCYIGAYEITANGKTNTYAPGTSVSLNSDVTVKPVWYYVNQYTVTLNLGCGYSTIENIVDAGSDTTFRRTNLPSILIESPTQVFTKFRAYTYNSVNEDNLFVVGYRWTQDGVEHTFNVLSENYTNASNYFELSLTEVNEDIVIEPIIETLGLTYTYTPVIGEEDYKAEDYYCSNRVSGLSYHIPYPAHEKSDGYTLQFYSDENGTNNVSSIIGDTVYYKAVHTTHVWIDTNVSYGNAYYPDGSCTEVKDVYGDQACKYCSATQSVATGTTQPTGNNRHTWVFAGSYGYNSEGHWSVLKCTTPNGCGGTSKGDIGEHNSDKNETIDPTCTEDGAIIYSCDVCGYETETEILPKLGHWESAPVYTQNDAYTHYITINCRRCKEVLSETTESHTGETSCSKCGYFVGCNHTYTWTYSNIDDTYHNYKQYCSKCGKLGSEGEGVWTHTYRNGRCIRCGHTCSHSNWTEWESEYDDSQLADFQCGDTYNLERNCSTCGKKETKEVTFYHDQGSNVDYRWETTDTTHTLIQTCTVKGCGRDMWVIRTEEHTMQTIEPTCTKIGQIVCSVCGYANSDNDKSALGHDWIEDGEWVGNFETQTPKACMQGYYHSWKECTRCRETKDDVIEWVEIKHNKVVSDPNSGGGLRNPYCSSCGYVFSS